MYKPGEIARFDDPKMPPWEWGVRQGGTMNKSVMKNNVLDFKRIMDAHGVGFFLIFGSLLGAVRNGDVIANDSDFDVFCFNKDYLKWPDTRDELRRNGFYITDVKPLHDDFITRNGEKIDINWLIPFGKFYVYDDGIYFPKEYFDTLVDVRLFDTTFKIPVNPDRILTDLYGNWRVPATSKGRSRMYPK